MVLCMLIGYSGHVVYHVLLPCSEFTVSAIKRGQLCLLVLSRFLFSPNTTDGNKEPGRFISAGKEEINWCVLIHKGSLYTSNYIYRSLFKSFLYIYNG